MANPLSTDSILKHMAEALPIHGKEDTNSDLSSSYEVIALFVHACMTAVGFRLVGFTEGQNMEAECSRLAPRLSLQWNATFNSHSFVYTHEQSSMKYLVKVDGLGTNTEIRAVGLGDERISRLEVKAKEYISSAALPLRISITSGGDKYQVGLEDKLKEVFVSPFRIQDLASLFKITIIQKLIPSLQKEGYEESFNSTSAAARDVQNKCEGHAHRQPRSNPLADSQLPSSAHPYPFENTSTLLPRQPLPTGDFLPPGFDDEYDLLRPRGQRPLHPAGSPFNIGHDDLNPPGLAPHDPLRGSFVGGGGSGTLGGQGGMHPTFDGPLFGGRGRGGGIPGVPEGARYDPLGPGDGPQRVGFGRPPNPYGGFNDGDFI